MASERRIQLIEIITRLFSEKGYASLGVSAIAEECKISKPTLYYYFKSKEQLLSSIIEHYGAQLRAELQSIESSALSENSLIELVNCFLRFTYSNPAYFRLYLSLIFTPHENRAYQIIKAEAEAIHRIVESILFPHVNRKDLVPLFAVSLVGQMNSFATIILNGYLEYSPILAEQLVVLFRKGTDNYEQTV